MPHVQRDCPFNPKQRVVPPVEERMDLKQGDRAALARHEPARSIQSADRDPTEDPVGPSSAVLDPRGYQ